jgi:hypothetical protein
LQAALAILLHHYRSFARQLDFGARLRMMDKLKAGSGRYEARGFGMNFVPC